jgi:hypothetical protein
MGSRKLPPLISIKKVEIRLLVSCLQSLLTKSGHAGEDLVGRFGPTEGRRVLIGDGNIMANGRFQRLHARVHAVAQLPLGQQGANLRPD